MAITITGGKYVAAYIASVETSTVTIATTIFVSGDFLTAARIVGLWNATGTIFKGYAHVRAWVSTSSLQLETEFFDPATGIKATQVVGDLVYVSKNFAECVVAGSLTYVSNKATFLTNAIFGTENALSSVCFYDEGRVIEATVNGIGRPAIAIAGGLVVFGHLQDYAANQISGGCFVMFTITGSQAGMGPISNAAIFCMHGGTINTNQMPVWNGGYYGAAAHTQVWNSVETYLDFMTPNIQPFNFNPTRQILRNVTSVITGVATDAFRWYNGIIEGGTAKLIGNTSLAVFGMGSGATTFNIGAPASQYYTVQDIQPGVGYFSTPCALWDNNTANGNGTVVNWTNVITPERTVARYNTTTNANFNWYWKQLYTNCKPSTIINIQRTVDSVIAASTTVDISSATLTILEQKQVGPGRTPAVIEDYSSWLDGIKCYGYNVITNPITRTLYSLGSAGNSNIVYFGGIVNQIIDSKITLSKTNALLLSSKISINTTSNTITLSSNVNIDEVYDYLIAWNTSSIINAQYPAIDRYPVIANGDTVVTTMNITGLEYLKTGTKFIKLQSSGTLIANAAMSDINIIGNVNQTIPTNLNQVTISGTLTYNTSAVTVITFTYCTLNVVTNIGSGVVTAAIFNTTVADESDIEFETKTPAVLQVLGLTGTETYAIYNNLNDDVVYPTITPNGLLSYGNVATDTGIWTVVIKRPGYQSLVATWNSQGNQTYTFTYLNVQYTLADGSVAYTTSIDDNVTIDYDGVIQADIVIGDAQVSTQNLYNAFENSTITAEGLAWIKAINSNVSFINTPSGYFIFLGELIRIRKGDVVYINSAISAFIISADGTVTNPINGAVTFLAGISISQFQEAIWTYEERTLNKALFK